MLRWSGYDNDANGGKPVYTKYFDWNIQGSVFHSSAKIRGFRTNLTDILLIPQEIIYIAYEK